MDNDCLSTFSIDVDTASYANVRRFLSDGELPPAGAVRTEELINFFRFGYPEPSGSDPVSITTELAACPWNPKHRLALIGLQGRALDERDPAPRNLAEFGMLLRESPLKGNSSFESVRARATKFRGEDAEGYRAQFVQLVDRAASLREVAKQSRR